jgi:hypothetical protein
MAVDTEPLVQALTSKLQVTIEYVKESDGTSVTHTGGIHEIGVNKKGNPVLWLWDVNFNDHIRQFLLANITGFQILNVPFVPSQSYGFKLNGQIIP